MLPETGSEVIVTVPAGAETARRLGVAEGEETVLINRVRAIASRPAILETVEVAAALMPGLEAESPLPNALYPHYQARHGISVISTEDRLRAVAADAAAAVAAVAVVAVEAANPGAEAAGKDRSRPISKNCFERGRTASVSLRLGARAARVQFSLSSS